MKKQKIWWYLVVLGLILGIKEGYIALFENGEPANIYPYQAKYLPKTDQKMLENGIPVHSSGELARLLEDYLS